jgi:hypothetical protein
MPEAGPSMDAGGLGRGAGRGATAVARVWTRTRRMTAASVAPSTRNTPRVKLRCSTLRAQPHSAPRLEAEARGAGRFRVWGPDGEEGVEEEEEQRGEGDGEE